MPSRRQAGAVSGRFVRRTLPCRGLSNRRLFEGLPGEKASVLGMASLIMRKWLVKRPQRGSSASVSGFRLEQQPARWGTRPATANAAGLERAGGGW